MKESVKEIKLINKTHTTFKIEYFSRIEVIFNDLVQFQTENLMG